MRQGTHLDATQRQQQGLSFTQIQGFKLLECDFQDMLLEIADEAARNIFVKPVNPLDYVTGDNAESSRLGIPSYRMHASLSRQSDAADWQRLIEEYSCSRQDDTLEQHLLWQLGGLSLPDSLVRASGLIIQSLDERGFIEDPAELSRELAIEPGEFSQALSIVQSLSPCGVARKSVRECLIAQIENLEDRDLLERLIACHWEDLLNQRRSRIQRTLGLTSAQLDTLLARLRGLTFIPANGFRGKEVSASLTFDIVFTVDRHGEVNLEVAGERIAEGDILELGYLDIAACGEGRFTAAEREELQAQRKRALALSRGIAFRMTTLTRLGLFIAREQKGFFLGGKACLKPLSMQEAADDLGLSLSAISRAAKDKHAYTPFGPMPLRDFFLSGMPAGKTADGRISRAAIESLIARAIKEEDPRFPLSDLELSELLKTKDGVAISRRTVSKYRDKLGIPPQVRRKALEHAR